MPLLSLSISQLLWVFVAGNLHKKLSPNSLFFRWLASKPMPCYLMPGDEELRKLKYADKGDTKKNQPKGKTKAGNTDSSASTSKGNEFKIKSSDLAKLELKKVEISGRVFAALPYGDELEWVVDLAFISLFSFIFIELLFYFSPRTNENNFSLLWVILVIGHCHLLLLQLTSLYFRNEVSIGERSICIVSGCVFLLLAMLVLTIDESRLELGVSNYLEIWSYVPPRLPDKDALLDASEIDTPPTPSAMTIRGYLILTRLGISVVCAIVGVIFTFPGFRFGQLHENFLSRPNVGLLDNILYNINYISSAVVVLLWIPAVSRNALKKQDYIEIDDTRFEIIRIVVLILTNLFRLLLCRRYTEIFLASIGNRIDKIRYRGGTTTNKEIQKAVGGMNNFVNVVSLQYTLPALICLYTSIMYTALKYTDLTRESSSLTTTANEINIVDDENDVGYLRIMSSLRNLFGDQKFIVASESILKETRRLLTSDLPKNVFNFATWWYHFAWFCTSTAGVVYHKYFYH